MDIADFIPISEVQWACQELGIRDWSQLATTKVKLEEARIIQAAVGSEALEIPRHGFKKAWR